MTESTRSTEAVFKVKVLRFALGQLSTDVGDFEANTRKILDFTMNASRRGVDIIVFPELCLNGYPPEDLLLKPEFLKAGKAALRALASQVKDIIVVVGFAERDVDVFNSAAVIWQGKVLGTYRKWFLPNYGVFDEKRYFGKGESCLLIDLNGTRVAVTICEDIWFTGGPMECSVARGGAEVVLNLSASPFERGKSQRRRDLISARCIDSNASLVYVNMVGAQDELVFDGGSCVYQPKRGFTAASPRFAEDLMVCDVEVGFDARRMLEPTYRHSYLFKDVPLEVLVIKKDLRHSNEFLTGEPSFSEMSPAEELYEALILGLREYVRKNGFEKVVVGLSGGIDSALTAALAVEALGSKRVVGVFLPSEFTSALSRELVLRLSENLGIKLYEISINEVHYAYRETLTGPIDKGISGTVDENLQARIRGNILMALSNRYGWLVLATGNKSEFSMGYCTIYGDMAGGFAVLKDVFKTQVYELARYLNEKQGKEIIPDGIIARKPTAELKPGQFDTDRLPPYETLDPVLEAYVESCLSAEEIINMGYDASMVRDVTATVDRNEYKRRQAPVGLKLTPRAFGRDWRMPISYHFPKL